MKRIIFSSIAVVSMAMIAETTMAEGLVSSNVMDDVLDRFHNTTSTWGPAIEAAASRLFWSLVVISMVWTFGMMAWRVFRGVRQIHDFHRIFLVAAYKCYYRYEYCRNNG